MLSDEWLPRYRLLENFTAKWNGNGNGNAYDRGDYNSSFALRADELKIDHLNHPTLYRLFKLSLKFVSSHKHYMTNEPQHEKSMRRYKPVCAQLQNITRAWNYKFGNTKKEGS